MTSSSLKPAVLIINGLAQQDGAGIDADKLTVSHHDCLALPVIISQGVAAEDILRQFEAIQKENVVQAIKIGLIPNLEAAQAVNDIVLKLPNVPVVLDLDLNDDIAMTDEVMAFIREHLLPQVYVLMTNREGLSKLIGSQGAIETNVQAVLSMGVQHCLVRDGLDEQAYDTNYFANQETGFYCYQASQELGNVVGTGEVITSSIASHLASGQDVRDAVVLAQAYLHRGMRLSLTIGAIAHSQAALALQDLPKLCYQADYVGKQFKFPPCPERLGIYPVVDSVDWVKKLVDCGVPTIQLRVKDHAPAVLDQQVKQAVDYLAGKTVSFFVNDYWQLAIEHQAYGVHLGQEDLHDAQLTEIAEAGLRLGVSTHSYWELARALAVNPSYIALGPIYATTSKQMPFSPQGEARLQQWVSLLKGQYPLVAIGGIDLPRAKQLKKTGVGSVAMISAITKADDYQQATQDLLDCWEHRQ